VSAVEYDEPEWAVGKTHEEILDTIAKSLRVVLNTPVSYGYDALADRYFITAPDYKGAYVDFLGRFLRDRRWDVLQRVIELLEEAVSDNVEQEKINAD
jgi:hypothetical protein